MQPITIVAQVMWWDVDTIFAHYLCPFCGESHARSFPFDKSAYESPQPDPEESSIPENPSLRFRFEFPFSARDGTSWYKIEKENARFVALDADRFSRRLRPQRILGSDEVSLAAEALSDLNINKDDQGSSTTCGVDQVVQSDRDAEIDRVLEEIYRGNCRYLKWYLEIPGKKKAFLRRDIKSGDYAVGLAAKQPHPNILQLLLENGAEVNKGDINDMNTPLIWAVRTLNYDNAWHLLNHHADKNARNIPWGLTAVDEANSLIEGDPLQPEFIKAPTPRKAEKIKWHLLADERRENPELSPRREGGQNYFFVHDPQKPVRLFKLISLYEPRDNFKTIAVLKRAGIYPDVAAMSGWKNEPGFSKDMIELLGSWTEDALQVGKGIDYEFPPCPDKDQGKPGQFNACHAEAKLIAFMVSEHVFLRSETVEDEELHELAKVAPSVKLMQAEILVDNEPCESCNGFREAIKAHCGLDIVLFNRFLP